MSAATNIEAMARVVRISLAELQASLRTAKSDPKIALSRGVEEAETLSRAVDRLCELLDARGDVRTADATQHAISDSPDNEPAFEVVRRLRWAASGRVCTDCGGVTPDSQ